LALSGHYAFIADEGAGLQVVDVANPDTLQLVGGVAIPYYTSGVAIYETYAYVAGNTGLHVVDISIPEAPVLVPGGGFDTPAGALKVDVCRPFLVVADGMSGLLVANLYDPASPVLVGEVSLGGNVLDVDATGSTVYAAVSGVGLVVVDITQPWAPRIVGGYNTPDGANGVRAYGGYVFVADAMSGLQILPAHCDNNPTVGVPETTLTAPRRCQLAQNYPNPFNPSTTILFDLPVAGPATLKVFDLRGRLVRSLVDSKWLDAGRHSAVWDGLEDRGQAMASGVYFYRLEAGDYVQTRRMTLIR
ncbi:T9SS type A sorting domain-containing protein, partial [bacterium]|nr:T9SS type A sorting domain-containing protein [bacterium]